jgi:hypothetical protein
MEAPLAEQDLRNASVRVVDGALALLRAELKLLSSYARDVVRRAGLSLFFAWAAMSLAQVALVLVVLSPVLLSVRPWPLVALTIGIAILLSGLAGGAALLAFRSVKDALEPPPAGGSGGSSEAR